MLTIRLPNGREVDINTNDPQAAARTAQTIFRNEHPQEFATWNEGRPLGGLFENFMAAGRGALGSVVEGAGAIAGEYGLPGEQTLRDAGSAITGDAPVDRRSFDGVSDLFTQFGRRPLETGRAAVGQALGSIAGSLAAPVAAGAAVAGLGAAAPVVGAVGLGTAIATGALQSTNELEQILRQEGIDRERARELAATVGPAIGALEGGAGGVLLSRLLGRQVRRETAEKLAELAARSRLRAGAREAAVGVGLEGGSEAAGGAARQATAAAETGNANIGERLDQVALDAILGGLGGGLAGGVAGARQPGQARRALEDSGIVPPGTEPPTPPAGPEAPSLPYEIPAAPAPIISVDDALRLIEANPNYQLPIGPDVSNEGIIAFANDIQDATYADEVAGVRQNIVRDFFGAGDVAVTPATLDAEGNPTAEVRDYTRSARTLFANILNARADGQLEGNNFTINGLLDVALAPYGLSSQDASRADRALAGTVLDGLTSQGLLRRTKRKKGGASYSVIPQATTENRAPGRPGEAPQTAEDVAAQQLPAALATWRNSPTPTNLAAVNKLTAGSPLLASNVENYIAAYNQRAELQSKQQELIAEMNRQSNTQAEVDPALGEALRDNERKVADLSSTLGNIEDVLAGRAEGTLRAEGPGWEGGAQFEPEQAPEFSNQVGLTEDPNFQNWRDIYNARLQQPTNELIPAAGIRVRDRAFIANLIQDRPQEAIGFVRDLAATRPPGSVLTAPAIQQAGQSLGVDITPTEAVQLYNVARQSGVINRTGVIQPPPVGFNTAQGLPSRAEPVTGTAREQEQRQAEQHFQRVVGPLGRLEWRDRLLLEDLPAAVQEHAQELGVQDISGVAVGDLAIISLADPNQDLSHIAIHEGFHIADYMGLITTNERAILNASRDSILSVIKKVLGTEAHTEAQNSLAEMRAKAINARLYQRANFGPVIDSILDKIVRFFDRIRNFLQGRGYNDWRSIYDLFYAGGMANREVAPDWRNADPDGFFHRAQQSTPEFRNWFGNSKVVDENGNPKVVYHATPSITLSKFDTARGKESLGSHFGTATQANSIAKWNVDKGRPTAVFPVYLKIENPLRMQDMGTWYPEFVFNELVSRGLVDMNTPRAKEVQRATRTETEQSVRIIQQFIRELGYDGIVYENEYEAGAGDSYIVFRPEQIKSATGNTGAFSPRSGFIGFQSAKSAVIQGRGGVNMSRIRELLGPALYGAVNNLGEFNVKELYQNSFDAIKAALEKGQIKKGKLDVGLFGHTITMKDNGIGMAPETLASKYLEIAGSAKEDKKSSGGFGIAKILFLYANKRIKVVTARDGKVATLDTTGDELSNSMETNATPINISVVPFDETHREMFPDGHGTFVEVELPATTTNPSTGEVRNTTGIKSYAASTAIMKSPLFANIDVTVTQPEYGSDTDFETREVYSVGSKFNPDKYTNIANVKFAWGEARIFASKKSDKYIASKNLHVLSNGLHQFSLNLAKDDSGTWDNTIPFEFYIDIKSNVRAGDAGYPISLNRNSFSETGKGDFSQIINYIRAMYIDKGLEDSAKNFGSFYYIDPRTGQETAPEELALQERRLENKFKTAFNDKSNLVVKDGTLYVDGREVPDVPIEQLKNFTTNTSELKVDPSVLNFDRAMIHESAQVSINGDKDIPLSQHMKNVVGTARYNEYTRFVGAQMLTLRDEIADVLGYEDLNQTVAGISIGADYYGVSVKLPFSGTFVNHLQAESENPTQSAYALVQTMIHEFAHHRVRSHDNNFVEEMHKIYTRLLTAHREGTSRFNFNRWQENFVTELTTKYSDILKEAYDVRKSQYVSSVGNDFADSVKSAIPASSASRNAPGVAQAGTTGGTGRGVFPIAGRGPTIGGANRAGSGAPGPSNRGAATTRRNTTDLIKGPMRWLSSPIMSIPKYIPSMRGVADTVQQLYTRAQEMTVDVDTQIEAAYKLQPQSVAKITRVWEAASRTRKKPSLSGLNAEERAALQGMMSSVQRGLDYFIESAAIHNFLPSANKPAGANARLEAFWRRHTGKHLWEIPKSDLLSASPEGYAEMQKYERIRNPYYMPQVGRGSHFVAAYKKGAGGKRGQLVGMVAYNPLNIFQRARGFADPEAAAVAQLQNEFDPATHIVMQRGQQFTNDSEAQNIRDTGDFISQYMDRLRQAGGNNRNVSRIIDEMTSQVNKATMERIFRPNKDILRAVTPANESSYILDVMPQYLLSMAKVQARRYTQEQYKDSTATLSPRDKEYWDELRNYATTPTEAFGGLRASAFFYYLGGAVDTALINLTQNFHTAAFLARDGGLQSQKIFGQTLAELSKGLQLTKFGKASGSILVDYVNSLPADERQAATRAIQQGIFTPVFTNESRSQFTVDGLQKLGVKNPRKVQRGLTTVSHYAGLLMASVEEFNRAAAFLSAYRLAKINPNVMAVANHVDNTNYTTPYDYAVGKVIDTQYLTTKEDRAYMQRFHPAAEVMTQFMSYPMKTIEQYARSVGQIYKGLKDSDPIIAKAGAVSLLGMVGPLIMLGGIFALPFADSLKEWAEELIKVIWGDPRNFDIELREALGAGPFAEAVVRGIPHQQGIASLSRRIALDPIPANDIMNMSLATVTGPAGSLLLETPQNAYAYYQNGDYWQLAASLLPRAAGNVVRGMQLHFDQEQYTRRGNRVITPQDVEQASSGTPASVRQALGFPPPEFMDIREVVGTAEDLNQITRTRSERISKELARILVNVFEAQRAGNADDMTRYNRQYGERFREILLEESERPTHNRVNPQHSAIVRRAVRDFYGIGSEEAIRTSGRRDAREESIRRRAVILGQD